MSAVEYKYFHYGMKETAHLASADPVLGEVMVRLGHVKREVIPDPFAALINGIVGQPDVVSFGDIAIRRGMEKLYGDPKLTKEQFDSYRNKYSPYGSVASIYLWELYSMSIEKKEVIKCPK
ncbi:hypothetical protein [Lacrimispora defluvii]|uniref:Uncharacterized protein n=1 Tax=Lacrimispora defluvii TaxID=2719233 RepID=A0ABX1VVN2_9FIRM|nr:hypothetical protein [Lacrimispora defluvii]NNJ30887.1 hypothetical protein [Lacrimispora defluvii]